MSPAQAEPLTVFRLLALCHECVPEAIEIDGEKSLFYQGPSPDETTLVDFAQKHGFEFSETSDTFARLKLTPKSGVTDHDVVKTYEVHRRMEFNSDRKRMSILLTD